MVTAMALRTGSGSIMAGKRVDLEAALSRLQESGASGNEQDGCASVHLSHPFSASKAANMAR